MEKYYQIGDISVKIIGDDDNGYYKAVCDYFVDKNTENKNKQPDLLITIANQDDQEYDFKPELYSLSGSISFNKSTYRIRRDRFSYIVNNLFSTTEPTSVYFYPKHISLLPIRNLKMLLLNQEVDAKDVYTRFVNSITNYSCLWYIFAITLMKKGNIFCHCGMLSLHGNGLVLTGTSGCGKTSTMLEMIVNHNYAYMAEDFGILDRNGLMFDMQKRMAVYQSDVKWGNPVLQNAIKCLNALHRAEWNLKSLRKINPMHYFSPVELFASNMVHKSKVKVIIFLQRQNNEKVFYRKIEPAEIAERMKTASFREIKEIYEILSNIRSVGGPEYYEFYPSVYELEKQYVKIAETAIQEAKCFELSIPLHVAPMYTAEEIVRISKE